MRCPPAESGNMGNDIYIEIYIYIYYIGHSSDKKYYSCVCECMYSSCIHVYTLCIILYIYHIIYKYVYHAIIIYIYTL